MEIKRQGSLTQALLHLQLVVQSDPMRDLLLLLHQIQPLRNCRVVLVLVLSHLEQHLDHVLAPLANGAFMEYRTESLEDGVVRLGAVLGQEQTDLSHEANGDLDRVVCGSIKAEEEDLKGDNLVGDVLVAKVGDEGGCGVADDLRAVSALGNANR